MLVLAMTSQGADFTTGVQQSAGHNWNEAIWQPGGVSPAAGNNYGCIAGGNPTRIRPPTSGGAGATVTFPGDSLTLEPGSEIRAKTTNGCILNFPGVGGKPGLILNGGNMTPGDSTAPGAFHVAGVMEVRSASTFDNESDNTRVWVIDAEIRGSAMLSIVHWTPGTNVFTVTHTNNPYSGTWNVGQGGTKDQGAVLVATGSGSLGSGNILVATGATIDIRYDLNNPYSYLILNNDFNGTTTVYATNILSHNLTFHDANIGGTQLAPGTYTYAQLSATFPGNFPAGGSGSITVRDVIHTLPATVLTDFINIDSNPAGYIEAKDTTPAGDYYVITGGGFDQWDTDDQMAFVYHRVSGDFDIKVQVAGHTKSISDGCCPKAAIMARDSLAGDSRRVMMSVGSENLNGNFEWLWRHGQKDVNAHNGGQTSDGYGTGQGYPNMWVRITRVGDLFTGYYSNDGTNWTAADDPQNTASWATGPLNKTLFVGLSVSKSDGNAPETTRAIFQHYSESLAPTNALCLTGADSLGCPTQIRLFFNHPVSDDALNTAAYSLTGPAGALVSGASRGPASNMIDLSVDRDLAANGGEGATYRVAVIGPIHDVFGNTLARTSPCCAATFIHGQGFEAKKIHVLHSSPGSDQYGTMSIDNYNASTSVALGMGTQIDGFPPSEDANFDTGAGMRVFESETGSGNDRHGVQIIGVLQPPADGNYIFAVATDDQNYTYLSTDDQPVNKVQIAHETTRSGARQYLNHPNIGDNFSAPQALHANQKYFLHLVSVNGESNYNAAVTWDNAAGPGTIVNGQLPIDETHFVLSRYAYGQIFYNLGPVSIVSGPADTTASEGTSAKFVVSLDGTPPYTYQWYTNCPSHPATPAVPVPYATAQVFTLSNLQEFRTNTHVYCVVGNGCGAAVTSRVATLTVLLNPIVFSVGSRGNCHQFFLDFNKPMNLYSFTPVSVMVVCSNNTAPGNTPTLVTIGTPSFGTNTTEAIIPVSPDLQPGTNTYFVTLTGIRSQDGLLLNPTPDTISFIHGSEFLGPFAQRRVAPNGCTFINLCDVYFLQPPTDQTNFIGLSAAFSAVVDGTPASTSCYFYQWLSNNVIIPGATSASYTTAPNTLANNLDKYSVMVSNDFSATLGSATNHVLPNPVASKATTLNNNTHVYVYWFKPVANIGSYSFAGGAPPFVLSQSYFMGDQSTIDLLVGPAFDPGATYTLAISGETDLSSHPQVGSDGVFGHTIFLTFTASPAPFCTDFSGGLPPGTIASGTTPPYVGNDGALHLTDAGLPSEFNYWTIPLEGVQTFPFFKAHWQELLGPGSGGIGNSAAGMSFNVGQNIGAGFTPEEGAANGLSVMVDTYNNGGNEVGTYVGWNGARRAFTPVDGGGLNGPPGLMKDQFVDVSVEVTPSGFVTFQYDTFVATYQIPNYTGIQANQFAFAAASYGGNEAVEIRNLCIMDFVLGNVAVSITPGSETLSECQTVTFTANATGSPWLYYQWLRNGAPIPGANSATYTTPVLTCVTDQGVGYSVVVTNAFSSATSAVSRLTLTCDTTPVQIVSVGSVNGCVIGVCMNKVVDPVTATNTLNWSINGGAAGAGITGITIQPDGMSLLIALSPCLTGNPFTVTETGVTDKCPGVNATSSATGNVVALGAVLTDVGSPNPGGTAFSCGTQFTLSAGGSDVWSGGDNCHFVYVPRCGDFDVKVKVLNVQYVGSPRSKGGLMARVTADPCSPMVVTYHNSEGTGGPNQIETAARYSPAACDINNIGPNPPRASDNPWLRLKRIGDQIIAYHSADGTTWIESGDTGNMACGGLPGTLLVGVFLVSGNQGTPATATFSDFSISTPAGSSCPPPIAVTVYPSVVAVGECGTATFTASAGICSLNNSRFQWFKNGVPVPGAHDLSYTTPPAVCEDNNTVFAFSISNQVSSSVGVASGTVKVDCGLGPPAIVSAGSLSGCVIGVLFNRPVDPTTATDPTKYSINDGPSGDNIARVMAGPDSDDPSQTVNIYLVHCLRGGHFKVCANGVIESCTVTLPSSSCVTGIVQGLLSSDVGVAGHPNDPTPTGVNFTADTNEFGITVGGSDLWGNSDHGHFVYVNRCGDFDVKVKVESLLYVGSAWAKAGLMARGSLDTAASMVTTYHTPFFGGGANQIESACRAVQGGSIDDGTTGFNLNNSGETAGSLYPNRPAASGNAWLRMQRVGDEFVLSHSIDGVNWNVHADTTATPQRAALPTSLYVGVFLTANVGNDGRTTRARFQSFSISPQDPMGLSTCRSNLTIVHTAPNIIITWPGSCCRLQGTASLPTDPRYPAVWVDVPSPSPVTLPDTGPLLFFRTIAP